MNYYGDSGDYNYEIDVSLLETAGGSSLGSIGNGGPSHNFDKALNSAMASVDKYLQGLPTRNDESKEPAEEKLGYEKGHKNSKGENAPWVIRSHEDNRVLASFAKKSDAEEHLQRMKQYSKTESKNEDLDKYIKDVKSLLNKKYDLDFDDKEIAKLHSGWMGKLDAMHYQGKSVEDCAKEVAAFCGVSESKQSEANGPFDAPIKDWYVKAYPTDDLGERLNGTFKGALQTLLRGDDIYDYICVGDSLIRERLFSQLSKMLDVDYDEIYNVWLNEGAASNELTAKLNKIGLKRTRTIPPTIKDKVNNLGRGVLPPKIVKVTGESKKSEANGADSPWQVKVEFEFEGEPQFTNVITYAGSEDEARKNAIAYMQREYANFKNYVAKEAKPLPKKTSERLFNKAEMEQIALSEARDLAGYRSDVISELCVVWHYGEDGATKLADNYSDVINDAYVEGENLPSETAREIARADGNTYANESKKSESRKKNESKKSEVHFEQIDTIVVPKWLWEAWNFGDEYGEDLDEHEQELLADFKEKYSDCHLEDDGEEPYFSSNNDFDSYGGLCYTVNVFKEK